MPDRTLHAFRSRGRSKRMGMDKFIVSARKYRPQTFDTVVGQSHITTTLRNAIRNGQLAHAFLFCGPRGVGKTTCARILAKTINCEKQTKEGEACNTCHSCKSFNEGTSLNIHELDAASNNSVDDIRTLVEQVRFAPQAGKYKVYIIDEVHMLTSSAFNAFLKTLEEPPPYAIFILATTEKHKILPTILSRCQIFDFKRITNDDTVEHLEEITKKEHIEAEKSALQVIAQKSEGCMRDALSIMDKIVSFTNGKLTYANTLEHLNILDADYFFRLLEQLGNQDLAGALLLFEEVNHKGFEGDIFLNGFSEFIRNLLVCKDERAAVLLDAVEGFKEKYRETAKKVHASWLISALNILNESEIQFRMARNKRLHVEMTLIKLNYLQQAIELNTEEPAGAKKKMNPEAKAVRFKKITPLAIPTSGKGKDSTPPSGGATLSIEIPSTAAPAIPVEEAEMETVVPKNPEQKTGKTASGARIASLKQIRQQFAQPGQMNDGADAMPLESESLEKEWKAFTMLLKDKKNPAAQSFENARLVLISENSFEVNTPNNLEQKFIEQERNGLTEFLQKNLHNKQLQYSITVMEQVAGQAEEAFPPNAKEQFRNISEEYPLVKVLKEKLKLDLDY